MRENHQHTEASNNSHCVVLLLQGCMLLGFTGLLSPLQCVAMRPVKTPPPDPSVFYFPPTIPTENFNATKLTKARKKDVEAGTEVLIRGSIDMRGLEEPRSSVLIRWQLPRNGKQPLIMNEGTLELRPHPQVAGKWVYSGHVKAPKKAGHTLDVVVKVYRKSQKKWSYVGRSKITVVEKQQ